MNIVIIGAGGQGRVVLDILRQARRHNPIGFLDADTARAGGMVDGLPIFGAINQLDKLKRQDVRGAIVAIGDNRVRLSYARVLCQQGIELVNAIHPAAVIATTAELGRNVVVAATAVIGTNVRVADSAVINTGAIADHESRVGLATHICPGAVLAGRVQVGEGAFVGLGAKVLPCLSIGDYAVVGAGAVVLEDVPPGTTVVGVPARPIRRSAGS